MSALALGGHLLLPAAARRPDDRVICDAACRAHVVFIIVERPCRRLRAIRLAIDAACKIGTARRIRCKSNSSLSLTRRRGSSL